MNRLMQWLSKLWIILRSSLRRFPETMVIALVLTILVIIENHMAYDTEMVLAKWIMVLALGIPMSSMLVLVSERLKRRWKIRILLDALLIGCGLIFRAVIPETVDDVFMIRYALATLMAYLGFTLIPYLRHREGYGAYLVRLITAFFVTYLYTIVLYLGLIAIIFAVDFLFDLNLDGKIYLDTFITAVCLFGLAYFLGKVPGIDEETLSDQYPTVLRILLSAIVLPLICIYTVVLYAYLVRVVAFIGWSGSFVSQLVLWYGFVSVVLLILVYPLKSKVRYIPAFQKLYPLALLVPMGMLLISMTIRIQAYGLTVPRAFVLLAWLWFVTAIVFGIVKQYSYSQWVVVAFIALFTIAVYAPVNLFTISANSQVHRLTEHLNSLQMLEEDRILRRTDLSEGDQVVISDLVGYLIKYRGLSQAAFIPADFEESDMEEVFGFSYAYSTRYVDDFGSEYIYYQVERPVAIPIADYEIYTSIWHTFDSEKSREDSRELLVEAEGDILRVVMEGEVIYEGALSELLIESGVAMTYVYENQPIELIVEETWGNMHLYLKSFSGRKRNEEIEIDYFDGDVFFIIND